jgi:hypothetical protein
MCIALCFGSIRISDYRQTLGAIMKMFKIIFKYILPIGIITEDFFSFQWVSESVVDGPHLYGLIYPQNSDAIGSSFAYEFYLKGILLNMSIYLLIGTLIYWVLIKRIKKIKTINGLSVGIWIIATLVCVGNLMFFSEYTFKWDYDFPVEYKEIKLNRFK